MNNTKRFQDIIAEGRLDVSVLGKKESIARNNSFFITLKLFDGFDKYDCFIFDTDEVYQVAKTLEQGCLLNVLVRKGEQFREDYPNFNILDITIKKYLPDFDLEEIEKVTREALKSIDSKQKNLVMNCWKGLKAKEYAAGILEYSFKGGLLLNTYDLLKVVFSLDYAKAQRDTLITLCFLANIGSVDYYEFDDNLGIARKSKRGVMFSKAKLTEMRVVNCINKTDMTDEQKDFLLHTLMYWNTKNCMSEEGRIFRSIVIMVKEKRRTEVIKNKMLGDIASGRLLDDYYLLEKEDRDELQQGNN